MLYAFNENFVLPLSHDEVVHGKGSLLAKMPGDLWQKFANLRLLHAYMHAQPGKKLLFMGGEIGQWKEWNHEASLEWDLLHYPPHAGLQRLVADLNRLHRDEPALHELDSSPQGFEWIDCNDQENSVLSLIRKSAGGDCVAVVFNLTPVPRPHYRVGVPCGGFWRELINTDAHDYGGSGMGNHGGVHAADIAHHGRPASIDLVLPPLSALFLKPAGGGE
jgi:1,4-alpha-glucan branching enzyme